MPTHGREGRWVPGPTASPRGGLHGLCFLTETQAFARSNLTLDEVLGNARIGIRKRGTRLICTDYIQRLKIRQNEKDEPVRLRVGRASTALADLVKNTQAHSLMLSQINTGRKGGASAGPEPNLGQAESPERAEAQSCFRVG